jgi:hypothetical protein
VRLPLSLSLSLLLVVAALGGCTKRAFRGDLEKSPDGLTYLVIEDDNGGGACDVVRVDGQPWKLNERRAIAPGEHTLTCGGDVGIDIPPGTTFHFDYWGP